MAPKGPSSRKRSTSLSYAKPTASSAAKYAPSSPTKPHSVATSSHAPSHTFFASRASQPPASSSLSSLSIALAKLDVPRPTRPNTSLGFNRDLCGELLKEKSSVTSQDDTNVGKHRGTASSVSRPLPLKRASTVGSMGTPQSSTVPNRQSELMLPPPVPQVKQSAGSNGGVHESTEQSVPKKINLRSGIVVGKPRGNISFGTRQPAGSNSTLRAFGAGALNGLTKGRVIHRASRQTSLPTVEGSPVKGGVKIPNNSSKEAQDDVVDVVCVPKESEDDNVFLDKPSEPQDDETSQNDLDIILATSDSGKGKGKEKILVPWDVAASRRASMASHLLSQSLSALPQTPARAPPPERRVGLRPGLRSSSSTYPSSSKEGAQTAPGALGGGIGTSNGAHVSAHGKSPADVSPPGSTDSKRGSLKVLKSCKIYVDVRTDEGDDAGGLFVEMLKGLGAKVFEHLFTT